METTKDVSYGIGGESADMLFVILGCLVKRLGGHVHISIEEIEQLDGGFFTDAGPDGITITGVKERPDETARVVLQ